MIRELSFYKCFLALCVSLFAFNLGISQIALANCNPQIQGTWQTLHITNVSYGSVNHPSGNTPSPSYIDYSGSVNSSHNPGATLNFDVDIAVGSTSVFHTLGLFIDYNNDGVFDNSPSEFIYQSAHDNANNRNFTITIPSAQSAGEYRMRLILINNNSILGSSNGCPNNYDLGEAEDYSLTVLSGTDPEAANDNLTVNVNSTTGAANQIDVSSNDVIGSDGSDGDDYSIASNPLTTAQGSTVTEVSDGIFEYIPMSNFIGVDSFAYELCDANGDCTSATVNVKIDSGICTPIVNADSARYISNVTVNGESISINNNSGFDGGYGDYTSLGSPADVFASGTYNLSVTGQGGQMAWDAYIDFNNDGDFDDAGEIIHQTPRYSGGVYTPINFTIPAGTSIGNKVLRIVHRVDYAILDPCSTGGNPGEFEDYVINVIAPVDPVPSDDYLTVVANSNAIGTNSIDVSVNDIIGADGSDGDDYSISMSPLTTAQGGTVTEVSEGNFLYVPATNFFGSDSFNYDLCDAANDCTTATVFITVTSGACIPGYSGATTQLFIDTVAYNSPTNPATGVNNAGSGNNSSGTNDGYQDFSSLSTDVFRGDDLILDIITDGANASRINASRYAIYIDWNNDFDFSGADELIYRSTTAEGSPFNLTYTIPTTATLGPHLMRIRARAGGISNNPCGVSWDISRSETEDYSINILRVPQDVSVVSNDLIIMDGSTMTSVSNNTNFGDTEILAVAPSVRTYTITNEGSDPLTLTGGPGNLVQISGDPEFWVSNQPSTNTLTVGQSTTFEISYDPSVVGVNTALISIPNTDSIKGPYDFTIEGAGAQIYPDTDGDGIPDNIDIDDDNDGIRDDEEQSNCILNPLSTTADVIFLNETFGTGINRITIDGATPGVTTTYCYEDGTTAVGANECDNNPNLGDGKYTVHYSVTNDDGVVDVSSTGPDMAAWSEYAWYGPQDHTIGDTNGRMAIFNADFTPGIFYETEIVGTVIGAPIDYSFYALNIDEPDSEFSAGELPRNLPNITVNFLSLDKSTTYFTYVAGDIPRCESVNDNSCLDSEWILRNTSLTLPVSDFVIQLVNNAPGGAGNDLALDDIRISQTLCDLDGDGVADVIDLDNDNDGIPNVYEIGVPSGLAALDTNQDATTFGDMVWVDTNENGMHDSYEDPAFSPRDTDNDSVPDYLDLDSDNDGILDVLENDSFGDLDVDGDGRGDGLDVDTGVNDDQSDGDGLLALIDLNDDDPDDIDHGTTVFVPPIDTDSDGIPDFIDLDSNDPLNDLTNGSDIDNSYYADQDSNNDGMVDETTDVDLDGVSDGNNDNDTSALGAPIDLDDQLMIDFDGRNDYLLAPSTYGSSLNEFSAMVWVLVDPSSFGNTMTIMGDSSFEFSIRTDGTYQVTTTDSGSNIQTVNSNSTIPLGKWVNITAIYNNMELSLYINGTFVNSESTNGLPLTNDSTFPFTLGKSPDSNEEQYFDGALDEVRLFDKALSLEALRRTMYQEIEANGTATAGKILPRDIPNLDWSNIIAYYDFNRFEFDQFSGPSGAIMTMYNIKSILPQSAPIPYVTAQDGDLSLDATLLRQGVWSAADLSNFDYSIIQINHEVTASNSYSHIGAILNPGSELMVEDGNHIENQWYLILNGDIDLQGDAQLVQTLESELDETSAGKLTRRQQGESDVYSYNYWSSPVGIINNTTNNNDFLLNMMLDETGPVQFTPHATGTPPQTDPATISGRWLYTFINGSSYNHWGLITPATTTIGAGEGWSQKGTLSSLRAGLGLTNQEYIFEGKPNNGEILIPAVVDTGAPVGADTSSLLGNPYPSAIDARQFISDNLSYITGEVLLWDQFRGTNHQLAYYEGGYATITQLATVRAPQYPGLGYLNGGNGPAQDPTFFIPVSQGFFVTIENNGDLQFNNGQRIFKQESLGESIFLNAPGGNNNTIDRSSYQLTDIPLIRLELIADNGGDREIVLGFGNQFADSHDKGWDSKNTGTLNETDLFVSNQSDRFIIAALDEITDQKVIPLGAKGVTSTIYKFRVKDFSNFPNTRDIWLHDAEMNVYHDLKSGDYVFNFSQDGLDTNRFEIVFELPTTLSNGSEELSSATVYVDDRSDLLFINGVDVPIQQVALYDISGKLITRFRESEITNINTGIKTPQLATGIYLVQVQTETATQSFKVVVK